MVRDRFYSPRGFVPWNEVDSHIVSLQVSPPNADKLRVNVRGLEKLCRRGGISKLVVTEGSDEVTQYTVGFNGVNRDGSTTNASAGRLVVPEVEASGGTGYLNADTQMIRASSWRAVEVALNLSQMKQAISETAPKGVRDAKAWANHLNNGIVSTVQGEGSKQLLTGGGILNEGLSLLAGMFQAYEIFGDLLTTQHPSLRERLVYGGFLVATPYFVYVTELLKVAQGQKKLSDIRFSLFGPIFPEIDLAVKLAAVASFRKRVPLIRAIE